MSHIVGPKGQVVIEKEIRDKLGIEPGWLALQQVVDSHMEIYFVPPEHNESLLGSLAPYIKRSFPTEEDLDRAREETWNMRAEERVRRMAESADQTEGRFEH